MHFYPYSSLWKWERDHCKEPNLWLSCFTNKCSHEFCISHFWTVDVVDMFFIKKLTFYCWCAFRFSLSQLSQLVSGLPSDDRLAEGPVNTAVSTTSPSATACQRYYPSGTRSPGGSFSPFLSPWALVMSGRTHMGTSSVLIIFTKLCKTSGDSEICFLPLRFSRN